MGAGLVARLTQSIELVEHWKMKLQPGTPGPLKENWPPE